MDAQRERFEKEKAQVIDHLKARFGDGRGMLAFMLTQLSFSGQPCDVTFYDGPPVLEVKIDPKLGIASFYGAGANRLQQMLESFSLSNGDLVSFDKIWTLHPMPVGGIPGEDLAAVDLREGEQRFGPNGETLREMIRNVYHCKSREEEERFLRRYLAS
jgi:hypothetical protein